MSRLKLLVLATLLGAISCNDPGESIEPSTLLAAYPNPVSDRLFVTANNTTTSEAQLIVFDPNGKIVGETFFGPGTNHFQFDVSNRRNGRFHIICKVGGKVDSVELLKK
jgi:hypothetical protein